jgi:uncharacterized SAM-binding protein YcdF (DUF218 family)
MMIRYLAMVFILLAAGAAALRRLALAYVPPAQRLRPADVLVVLGHPANADGSPSPAMQEQVALAAALQRAGLARALLFTGGAVHNEHIEAQVMAELAVRLGVPAAAIATETQARDTFENARYCRQIMQARGWQDAIVVTTPYHARRASRIFHLTGIAHQMAWPAQSYQCASWRARIDALRYDLLGQIWLAASQLLGLDPSWWAERRSRRRSGDGKRSDHEATKVR